MMGLTRSIHDGYVHNRRVLRIADLLAGMMPADATVLDVGCGDGLLARRIQDLRPDLTLRGLEVLVRGDTMIPVEPFDGRTIPAGDASVDVVMFVDVLHHTDDPMILLREAARVARDSVVLKDHTRNGFLSGPTLRFMDYIGNAHHGVALPYNYWPRDRWHEAFARLGLTVADWRDDLRLYPRPADWIFGRSLHFGARLRPGPGGRAGESPAG